MFSSKDEWLLSLPGNPCESDIHIYDENPARNPDPNWKFTPTYDNCTITWPAKIYNIIMQANSTLKDNEDLRQAFNHLVDVIDSYKDRCVVYLLNRLSNDLSKYDHIFPRETTTWFKQDAWELLPINYRGVDSMYDRYYTHPPLRSELGPKIYEAYLPLFGLMETHGVLKFVREKLNDNKKENLKRRIREAEAAHRRLDRKKNKQEKALVSKKAHLILYTLRLHEELEKL